jgi:hypothetical protein
MFENKYNSFMEFYGDVCDDPRDPIERKLAVMKKKNICFGGGKGSAPDTNPGMLASAAAAKEIAAEQAAVARESLAFYKQQYEEFKPVLNEIMQGEVDMQKANKARADEYAAYEKETYRPLEQELVRKAKEYNTEAKREQLATAGAADVSQAFGVSRGQMQRQQSAAGIAPNSGRFAALNQQMMTQEALARAGAMNNARTMAEDRGNALMYDAAGLGRNLATNASTAYGVSQNAAAGAKQSAQTGGAMMGQGYNSFNQGMSGANNAYGTAGNIYGQEFSGRMQGYQAQQQANSALWQGLGSAAGTAAGMYFGGKFGKADGGPIKRGIHVGAGDVSGPGGPVDDQIPAMLSDGEYVLPADTVQKIGRKKLDKLVKETHTPAAIQRKRKALKGKK